MPIVCMHFDELKTSESSHQKLALVSSVAMWSPSFKVKLSLQLARPGDDGGLIFHSYEIHISILILKLDYLTDVNLLNSCEHLVGIFDRRSSSESY